MRKKLGRLFTMCERSWGELFTMCGKKLGRAIYYVRKKLGRAIYYVRKETGESLFTMCEKSWGVETGNEANSTLHAWFCDASPTPPSLSQATSCAPPPPARCTSSACCWAVAVWSWTAGPATTAMTSSSPTGVRSVGECPSR